ncbi:MAG: HEAT repeat domain-containing protein [Phycisphaerales bacterium]|nr:MAG: HEAT repeat domain-containing protein [Phycisphaerales bacterium]
MRSKQNITTILGLMAVLVLGSVAWAQDTETLVRQLSGKAEAPARSGAQLVNAYQKAIDYLLPRMSAEDVESRYSYQIMFQDLGSHAARPGAEAERETLAKVIVNNLEQAEMPATVRHWFVLQLERIGKGEAVPALAKLLSSEDRHLADYARRALEKNPAENATATLLKALGTAQGSTWKIGLINSLGRRQAQDAIAPIAAALADPDPKVGAAAVTALAGIGGPESGRALVGELNKPVGPISLKAAQGLTDIAQELARQSNHADAAQIYEFLYVGATQKAQEDNAFNPFSIRAAALNGLAVSGPDKLAARMAEIIQDDDPKIRVVAVGAARLAPTKAPMQILCDMLLDLEPYEQIQVLGLIADRGDLSSTKYAKEALASDDEGVQLAAIDVLTRVGVDEGAELLMEVAINGRGATRRAAERGLALMAGPRVDEMITDQAASGDAKVRAVALGLLSKRRVPGATEALLGYASEGDEAIRSAAFDALVDVADLVDLETLAGLVAETKADSVRRSGIAALEAALAQASNKNSAAQIVINEIKTADADAKIALLSCLDAVGGPRALRAVVDATQASGEALRDAGIRTLSNWPDFAAAPTLLGIASKSETSLTHYVLALRGALRLIGTSDSASLDERARLCFVAFDCARRDDERRQAIAVMGSLPSPKVAERLLSLAREEDLKVEAALAAVELAGRSLRRDRQAARELAEKIRALNISDEVNRRADGIIRGRRR